MHWTALACLLPALLLLNGCSAEWREGAPTPTCPGGKCDSPTTPAAKEQAGSVGRCLPFVPYPGYRTCLMSEPQNPPEPALTLPLELDTLPKAVDHRDAYLDGCIEVHSQGSCGWCTAHATTAALEAMLCKGQHPYRRISEPHLWWLGKERGTFKDCEGGWLISSAFKNLGTMTDAGFMLVRGKLWPYTDDVDQMNKDKPADAALYKYGEHGAHASEVGSVPSKSVAALKQALAAGYNVVYSVPTFHGVGWKWWDSTFGDISAPSPPPPNLCTCDDCPKEPRCLSGYHAILITGYDESASRFLFLNSWGSYWGHQGYGTIDYATISSYGSGGRYAKQLALSQSAPPPLDAGLPDAAPADATTPDAAAIDAEAADAAGQDVTPAQLDQAGPGDAGSPKNGGASCASPATLPLLSSPTTVSGDTAGAPDEFGLHLTCGSQMTYDAPQRYYRVTLSAKTAYSIKVTPVGYDVAIYAFPAGTACAAQALNAQCKGHLADAWGGTSAEQLTLTPAASGDWIVVVDSFDPQASGPFTLTIGW